MSCSVRRHIQPIHRPWRRAGIIPFSYSGQYSFLLGRDHIKKGNLVSGSWSDFGGMSEERDETEVDNAAREAYEESMGVFGSVEQLKTIIANSVYLKTPLGTTFFVDFWYHYSPAQATLLPIFFERFYSYLSKCFHLTPVGYPCVEGCPEGYFEKQQLQWFSEQELRTLLSVHPRAVHRLTLRAINGFLTGMGRPEIEA